MLAHCPQRNLRGPRGWKPVHTCADGWKRNRLRPMLARQFQAPPVTPGKQRILAAPPAAPHRTHGMKHPLRRQTKPRCCLRVARGAAVQLAAGFQQLRPRRPMDRPIHAPAAQQRRVGRIHNRVHSKLRDIPRNHHQLCHGTPPDGNAALAIASLRTIFGIVSPMEQRSREAWQFPTIESIGADLRFALRQFRKSPAFALTAIFVLALGVAASVSIFSFVNAALLKPLPYQSPSRLVAVFESTATCPQCSFSYPDYQDWKRTNSVFQSLEIWGYDAYLWRSSAGVESRRVGRVSGGFFQTLGVNPMLGRLFTPADDSPESSRTVVLPYVTWQSRFGARPDILGESITLDNNAYTVIGVLPRSFQFSPRAAELWVTVHDLGSCERDRSCRPFSALARLKDGVTVSSALAN